MIKKRRTPHGKSSRQQQLLQQQQLRAKQRFENSRLKPEQVSSIVHDESDTLSYRSYLMVNFVRSAEFMDVLMTQPVANRQIKPPTVYGHLNVESLKTKLESQKEELSGLQEKAENYKWNLSEDSDFLRNKIRASAAASNNKDKNSEILEDYLRKFGLRSQENTVVFHRNKFSHLRSDTSEAPPDYWSNHRQLKKEQREKALALQRQKELEEAEKEKARLAEEDKRRLQMEEERKRKEEEQKEQQQMHLHLEMERHFDDGKIKQLAQPNLPQQSPQQLPGLLQAQAKVHLSSQLNESEDQAESQSDTPQQVLQPNEEQHQDNQQALPAQNGIDSIFGDFGNEPFNNGFDDEFGELDTAFF